MTVLKPNEAKLKRAVEHITYEIDMFRYAVKNLSSGDNHDNLLRNVLIESFVVHAYNLFKFFYLSKKDKTKATDIIVGHYINNQKNFNKNRSSKNVLEGIVGKRNKQLAHLTYSRIYRNKKTKPWKI